MKLYFLRQRDTSLAEPDASVIDSVRSELLQRPNIFEAASAEHADAIVLHEPWAFREWRYIEKLLADPVTGRYPHKVYTINNDDAGTGLLRGVYAGLRRSRLNPAIHASVPFLSQHNEFVLQRAGAPRPQPTYLATWRGNPRSNVKLRTRLLEVCSGSKTLRAESSASWLNHDPDEKSLYVDLLLSGKFALCPGGWTPATYRIYESMALGVMPVIIADEYVPPAGPNWDEISLRIPEAELPNIERELNKHAERYLEFGRLAHEAWQRHFRPELLISCYCDALLSCVRSSAGTGSASEEIKRWRSPRMYWSNQWSIPQRLGNRFRRLVA